MWSDVADMQLNLEDKCKWQIQWQATRMSTGLPPESHCATAHGHGHLDIGLSQAQPPGQLPQASLTLSVQ
jgi:hypothetical protein